MKQKIKLIYVLPEYNEELDGHIYYLVNFIKEVAKEIDIFLIIEKSTQKNPRIENIKNIYVQKFTNPKLRFLELFYIILKKRITGYKRSYIHYSYIGAIVSGIIMRISGGKTYYWSCGMMWLFGKQPLLKITLKLVNYLVTGVNALKDGYSQHYGIKKERIIIMPNWIEMDRVKNTKINKDDVKKSLGFSSDDKIVLFLHRLAERKGIHYVPKIAESLKMHRNIKFLIIGDGPYKEKLLEEKKNGNLENITYIGKAPNREVYKYFLISDIFLMPSEEEGFPRVLLESMACNVPYVASDIGGVREISTPGQQQYIYNVGDVQGFSQGILQILDSRHKDFSSYIKKFDIYTVVPIFIGMFTK